MGTIMETMTGTPLLIAVLDQNKEDEATQSLDGLVHDCKSAEASIKCHICPNENPDAYDEHHNQFSMQATDINNQGLLSQMIYLYKSGYRVRAEALIKEILT
jgi:hypothetical protein|tara:strand:+ start:5729 stop:6034 length:306 start_codon:yes stop_codon:yes gene_type:complete